MLPGSEIILTMEYSTGLFQVDHGKHTQKDYDQPGCMYRKGG